MENKITERRFHPAPQWMREKAYILSSGWTLNGQPVNVPYPPESELSGFKGDVPEQMTYECKFLCPGAFSGNGVILHFGAVDQVADVIFNGKYLGRHEGGYLNFSYDITGKIKKWEENHLIVKVTDTLSHEYPYGKQRKHRGGMWYTPVSGIWQRVWLENVPESYLMRPKMIPDCKGFDIEGLYTSDFENKDVTLSIKIPDGEEEKTYETVISTEDRFHRIDMEEVYREMGIEEPLRLWTPDNPYLYDLSFSCGQDRVDSYIALRKVEVKTVRSRSRICLNEKPVFLQGVLDQGYFPEGIYVPDSLEEYEKDILRVKDLGFNFIRKHIKVEPEAFYYAADRLGILVMQDMVNSGPYEYFSETIFPNLTFKKRPDTLFTHVDRKRKDFFIEHCKETVEQVFNHPCIVAYTIFNEGWGQFESDRIYELMKGWDATRIIDSTSGWFAQKKSDVDSEHIYFHNERLFPKDKRPMILSECGGFGYPVEGHVWTGVKNAYVYGKASTPDDVMKMITDMYLSMIIPAIEKGLCGVVYTQITDVEEEVNGLYTYDREVCKVVPEKMRKLSDKVKQIHDVMCG
ncbi:MAG: hypothetical protein K6A69_08590 [Lachnospiraceae bacterium]|nr:hypothetical protein [Lachnospiraceae bacterium]